MAVADVLQRFVRFMAGMGLLLHDDPPKVIELEGREWGPVVDGLRLSIQCRPPVLSVVLRNVSAQPLSLTIPGWLFFFQVEIDAPMSGYGQALLKPERRTEQIALTLKPGEPTETDIPVSLLFVNPSGHYARVVCVLPDGSRLESNRTLIR